jgi:Ca-activated chloride channel family protein
MTDPLDDLKAAFSQVTPLPDAPQKRANLENAQKIFDATQGSADPLRPTSDRPRNRAGFHAGVAKMFSALTTRPALTATTALVAVGLVALLPVLRDMPTPGGIGTLDQSEAPTRERAQTPDLATKPAPVPVPAPTMDGALNLAPIVEPEVMLEEMADSAGIAPAMPRAMSAPKMQPGVTGYARGLNGNRNNALVGQRVARPDDIPQLALADTEAFANEDANPVKITLEQPVSTFSIDVDTASYSIIRSSLMNGYLPNADAVRIEEMVNYFPYAYPTPTTGEGPFKPTVSISTTPWNPDTKLMQIALQGELPAIDDRPPLNLVFLIDTSGSMDQQNKLPLLKQSFRLMLGQLSPDDQISIVTYAGSAGRVLDPTPAAERSTILAALDRLNAGASTAGQAGLQQAYATAEEMAAEGEVTRVILATDGDFNVGINDPEALKDFIAQKRDSGTYLSVLGFGRGNLDDATMQALAQNGNGQAAYIDTLSEAQKVLVDQLTGALFPIANDVKIQVEFNPATVAEYRLIGYETRALRREDFNNDKVDAGEIGAGHSVTAIYEVTPVGSPAVLNDPLRFGAAAPVAETSDDLAFLRLRYKTPGEDVSQLLETPISPDITALTSDSQFAAAIAGFGQLLKSGGYTGDWTYENAITLAEQNVGDDPFGYRREAITLMRLAQSLSQ